MDVQTLALSFRGAERLLIVAVAALCIRFGYKLFQSLPVEHSSGGSLKLPSARVVLSKVGPGVFFALFGALVLWEAVRTQLIAPANTPSAEKAAQLAPTDLRRGERRPLSATSRTGRHPGPQLPGERRAGRARRGRRRAGTAHGARLAARSGVATGLGRGGVCVAQARRDPGERSHRRDLQRAASLLSYSGSAQEMIGRRDVLRGCCCGLVLLAVGPARAQQRLGPYTRTELESVRGKYEPYVRGLFFEDLLGRLPPAMREPLGEVQLNVPAEMPAGLGADPAFVLNVAAVPARRQVYLPLRTLLWLHEYSGLVTELERRKCADRLAIVLIYSGMLTRRVQGNRPPGPLVAFGLDDGIYGDAYVGNVSSQLFGSTLFFLLAHELGHIARGHAVSASGINSQLQEREADAYALNAMASVGLMPLGLAAFFSAAAMMEGGQDDASSERQPRRGGRACARGAAARLRRPRSVESGGRSGEAARKRPGAPGGRADHRRSRAPCLIAAGRWQRRRFRWTAQCARAAVHPMITRPLRTDRPVLVRPDSKRRSI